MSTRYEHYIIFAVDLGYDNVDYDEYEDEIERNDQARFDMIFDGMNGNYVLAGKILAEADMYDGFDVIDVESLIDDTELTEVANRVVDCFPNINAGDFKLIVLTHFH